MKIDRLLGILTILLRKEKATFSELADRFEVSRRTISRDVDDLCRAGIPLVTMQGYGGGVSIAEGYQIDRALLKKEELEAIFAGLDGIDSISPNAYSASLAEKLTAGSSRLPFSVPMRISLYPFAQDPLMQKLETIKTAIQERRRIAFRYFYNKGECDRAMEPYYLLYQWSAWYVWGRCLLREDLRLFKLDRLWSLEIMDERFPEPTLADPERVRDDYFTASAFHLRARFSEAVKYRLIEEYGPDCYMQSADGLLLERDFASYDNLREWVLSFGDQAEVLEPQSLREDLRRQAENLLRRYRET